MWTNMAPYQPVHLHSLIWELHCLRSNCTDVQADLELHSWLSASMYGMWQMLPVTLKWLMCFKTESDGMVRGLMTENCYFLHRMHRLSLLYIHVLAQGQPYHQDMFWWHCQGIDKKKTAIKQCNRQQIITAPFWTRVGACTRQEVHFKMTFKLLPFFVTTLQAVKFYATWYSSVSLAYKERTQTY